MNRMMMAYLLVAALAVPAAAQQAAKPLPWLGMGYTWMQPADGRRPMKIQKVTAGGPAERAGLRAGDVVTMVQDGPVDFGDDLDFLLFLEQRKPGELLTFGVLRDGHAVRVPVVLGVMPEAARPKWEQALEMARRRRIESEGARSPQP
jgi:S1-C subfamily serine protease